MLIVVKECGGVVTKRVHFQARWKLYAVIQRNFNKEWDLAPFERCELSIQFTRNICIYRMKVGFTDILVIPFFNFIELCYIHNLSATDPGIIIQSHPTSTKAQRQKARWFVSTERNSRHTASQDCLGQSKNLWIVQVLRQVLAHLGPLVQDISILGVSKLQQTKLTVHTIEMWLAVWLTSSCNQIIRRGGWPRCKVFKGAVLLRCLSHFQTIPFYQRVIAIRAPCRSSPPSSIFLS